LAHRSHCSAGSGQWPRPHPHTPSRRGRKRHAWQRPKPARYSRATAQTGMRSWETPNSLAH